MLIKRLLAAITKEMSITEVREKDANQEVTAVPPSALTRY